MENVGSPNSTRKRGAGSTRMLAGVSVKYNSYSGWQLAAADDGLDLPIASFRPGFRRSRSHLHGGSRVVDPILQLLAGFEVRDLLRRHFHPRARLRISPDPRLPLARAKTTESTNFDLVGVSQRANNTAEDRLDDDFGFLVTHF